MDPRESAPGTQPQDDPDGDRRRAARRQDESEFQASGRPSRAAPVNDDDSGFDFGLRGGPADADTRRQGGRRTTDEFEASRNY
jgi:hypothetical protein